MSQIINTQYNREGFNGTENISSDTLYLKERFQNNLESFNNTVQGLKQCIEQIKRSERESSSGNNTSNNQKIDKFQRVEQMLLERRNKLNVTNQSQISQNTERFNNQQLTTQNQIQPTSNNIFIQQDIKQQDKTPSTLFQGEQSKNRDNLNLNHPQLQKFQQFQNILEPEDNQFDSEGSSFLRGGVEELIKQKIGVTKCDKEGINQQNTLYSKTERDSIGSALIQNESQLFYGIQRSSEFNEFKAQQFLQEVQDEDSIALPEYICRLFPDSSQTLERNRLSEIERDFNRKSYGSVQSNQNNNNMSIYQKEEQEHRTFQSNQDRIGQTQLELDSAESSAVLQEMNIYQFYSNQQHALPIEDRLYVKNLSRENKIKQLQESQKQRIEAELQKVPKISQQSDVIARNSTRFQENPDLISRLMKDKQKKEQTLRQKKQEQTSEDEHRFTFAPQINQQSATLNRSIENLYQWDQKRKIKQNQAQKQTEEEEIQNLQKMKQSIIISEGSKKIIGEQTGGQKKVEVRLIREGQSIQAKKKLQQEKENRMIKEMSNRKVIQKSLQSNNKGLNSFSKIDDSSSQINTTKKALTKQYSCDKLNGANTNNNNTTTTTTTTITQHQAYVQYCPNSFSNTNQLSNHNAILNNDSHLNKQDENDYSHSASNIISKEQFINTNQYSSQNNINQKLSENNQNQYSSENNQNCMTKNLNRQDSTINFKYNQLYDSNNNSSFFNNNNSSNIYNQKSMLQDAKINMMSRQQSQFLNQSRPTHQKAFSLHIDSKNNNQRTQGQLQFPLNALKQSEKIILPKSSNGRVSVESLIQSAQFRKTKIFASDSQNMIILDKADAIQMCNKNLGTINRNNNQEGQIIDINSILIQRQESSGIIKTQKLEIQNTKEVENIKNNYNNKENAPQSGRSNKLLSKQSSQSNLIQNKNSNVNQQSNLFFEQIKNEKNSPSYSNQFQKRKLLRTNSCLTAKYFSLNQ